MEHTLIDFEPNGLQRTRWELARDFAVNHVIPAAAAIDRKGEFPWELVEKGVRAGFTTMLIPAPYGGGGYDNVSDGLVLEELGAACAGVATIFGASILGVGPILLLGSDEQKKRLLRPITEDSTGRFLCAFAVTESGSGSAASSGDPAFGVQSSAHRDGKSYVISGSKRFISNGTVAKLFSVLARTQRRKSTLDALSFFAVAEAPRLHVTRVEDKMGQCACPTAELYFDQVRVPEGNLLGGEGLGVVGFSQTICVSGPLVAAICVGLARAGSSSQHTALRRHSGDDVGPVVVW